MKAQQTNFYKPLFSTFQAIEKDFDKIPIERKESLKELANYISQKKQVGDTTKLTFICTHNSRRSHLGQIMAASAAAYYNVNQVETFSGGTEATAFNPRAVKALMELGFKINEPTGPNPHYLVKYAEDRQPLECFSKKYDDGFNPNKNFCAVMTCSQADEACPFVPGADFRLAIPYEDPKAFDGTALEAEKYKERSLQIAREMFYTFFLVSAK